MGVACKETAYAYPLLLTALFLIRRPLRLPLPRRAWFSVLAGELAGTIFVLLIRIAIYGNFGGYPAVAGGGNVNFILSAKDLHVRGHPAPPPHCF